MQCLHHLWTSILAALGRPAAQLAHARQLLALGASRAAFPWLVKAAKAGIPAAWYELGRAYLLGYGVPPCQREALCWVTRAADAGEVAAQSLMARLALQGVSRIASSSLFVPTQTHGDNAPDYDCALHWAERAAVSGSADADALLGVMLSTGPPHICDLERGAEHYRRAAAAGNAQGQLGWALVLLGRNSAETTGEALDLLEAAAQAGLPVAHYVLGMLAESGAMGSTDFAAAAEHYRVAAECGHRSAQLRYGIALLTGHGVAQNAFNGESWLRRAGLAGEPLASALIGQLYICDHPLPPNKVEALTWFRRAAEAGHAGAARALGHLYLGGGGICGDPQEAALWLRYAIVHGDTEATADLARLALARKVPETDQRTTFAWFLKQAETGDPAAVYNLGVCFAEGIGTPRDEARALALLHNAAEHLPAAQYWYGRMLAEGRGCHPDIESARAWFLRAAEQHNADAEVAAGEMLINGRGGPPDPDQAMALFRRAAATGHAGALLALRVLGQAKANDRSADLRVTVDA